MSLRTETMAFQKSIEGYKASDYPSPQLYDMFNAIVEQAHQQLSDSAVVSTIKTVDPNSPVDVGTLRASLALIFQAAPRPRPGRLA